jgi:lysozyme
LSIPPQKPDRFGLTPELVEAIKLEEGLRLKPYLCQAGYPTIGWGHRIPSLAHPNITPGQAQEMLDMDLIHYRNAALRLSPGLRTEPERRIAAVIDFCFNLGIHAYAGSTLRKKVNQKLWKEAGEQMRKWVYALNPKTGKKEPLAALVRRRDKFAKMLEAE